MINPPFLTNSTLAAYLRDSGGESQELSTAQQESALKEWAVTNGYVITHWFKDEARPGSSAVGREGFQAMMTISASVHQRRVWWYGKCPGGHAILTIANSTGQIGVLITMQEPTKPMRSEAAGAGFYKSQWGSHPRLQILTIAELQDGKKIDMPPIGQVNVTFKKAPTSKKEAAQPPLINNLESK